MSMNNGNGDQPVKATPAEVYEGLRIQALHVTPEILGYDGPDDEPYGVIMETGYQKAVVTLVAFGDGSASLYFSVGGGIIGGGNYEPVRQAATELVATAALYVGQMTRTNDYPSPSIGRVRFYVLTPTGIFTTEETEESLEDKDSPYAPLFYSAHAVITELRLTSETKGDA